MRRVFVGSIRFSAISAVFRSVLILVVLSVPQAAHAQWQATLGAQSADGAKQAMALLPNELWILQGENITWTTKSGADHTVTFLKPGQIRSGAGCPGTTPSGSSYDGAGVFPNLPCVNSGPICDRSLQNPPELIKCLNMPVLTYTVNFPTPGNFKFVCLIHKDMTGVVHVLPTGSPLPHINPDFYENQAADQARAIISDTDHTGSNDRGSNDDRGEGDGDGHAVITTGEVVATGGGRQYLSIMRFLPGTIRVHVGDTVEWTNIDPTENHTVTFGDEPADPTTLIGVTDPDLDLDRHGTLPNVGTNNSFNSGFIGAALQDQTGKPQTPPGVTRARVTFTSPGTYDYFCIIHDQLGMKGQVIVRP